MFFNYIVKMNIYLIFGNISVIISRLVLFGLSITTVWQWTSLVIGLHFLIMMGWIIEQKSTQNKNEGLDISSCLKITLIYCFYFHYFANGNLRWRRRFFNFLLFLEATVLLILYIVNSRHGIFVVAFGSSFVAITFFMGVIFLEYDTYCCEKTEKELASKEGENVRHPDCIDSIDEPCAEKYDPLCATPTVQETINSLGESSKSTYKIEIDMEEPLAPLERNRTGTMCSIQDLLANTSQLHSSYEDNDKARNYVTPSIAKHQSNCSINEVGLPLKEGVNSFSSSQKSVCRETPDSSAKLDSHYTAKLNANDDMSCVHNLNNENEYMEACEIVRQDIESTPNEYDYENIYDAVPADISSTQQDSTYVQPFPSKSLNLLHSADESCASASVTHDYENIPALNVHRASTGVRHWNTYLDIEDRIHDYSTYKERSEIQDSTFASNLHTTNVIVTNISPYRLLEKTGSHHSISLPDLSNITPATYVQVEQRHPNTCGEDATPNNLVEFHGNSTDGVHVSNYETIWYEEFKDNENQIVDNGTNFVLGVDSKIEESLCNLYYSRLSELSSKYFSHGMKRINSMHSISPRYEKERETRSFSIVKPQLVFELNSKDFASCLTSDASTPKDKKLGSKRTQKSPLMKLVSLGQNSLHEHTAKALQAGKRVFYRPRIHVITPKGKAAGAQRLITFKESSVDDDRAKQFSIDPCVLRKRAQLSPKNKLILSEASALIRKQKDGTDLKNCSSKESPHDVAAPESDDNEPPQHSTPEGNRHIPQISILSTISSVASPDEIKVDIEEVSNNKNSFPLDNSLHKRILSKHPLQNGKRCSAKILSEMSVIQEFEQCPSQV